MGKKVSVEEYVAVIGEYTLVVNGVEFPFVQVELGDGSVIEVQKHPMTQSQYEALTGKNPSHFAGKPNNPVESVSWHDARAAAELLSKASGRSGFRLPTEHEWEKLARGTEPHLQYAGSDDPDEVAWHSGNSNGSTQPVGMKKPNSLGLYDMSGNVWEWTDTIWGE